MPMNISRKFCGLTKAKIELFDTNEVTHVWREGGAASIQKNTTPTMKYDDGNIMVWRCFAYNGPEKLKLSISP